MEQGSAQPLQEKNTFSDEFLVLLQQWCYSLEPARLVLRLVLPCISPADPHLGPRLPCQLGGRESSSPSGAAASVESQITWQRAAIQRTSQSFLPGDSVPFIFPGTCPALLARRLAFQVSSAEPRSASSARRQQR